MRPIELVIEGFRSYDRRTAFDWRERQLVGIVGPIGSGKSSILDAITFALYGKTPVFERENKTLIREGRESARVELVFSVEGQTWRALRVIRRRGAGQHAFYRRGKYGFTLECDREKQVTERIATLLGLDFQAFCRSVLLAQNRFAEFLHASPADRDKVLKGVFGFDRLDVMQRLAKERRIECELEGRELRGRLSHLDEHRRKLDEQRAALEQAQTQSQALDAVAEDIRQLDEQARQAARTLQETEQRLQDLDHLAEQLPTEDLAPSGRLEATIHEQQAAEDAWQKARQRVEAAEKALESTIAETGSGEELAAAEQTLLHLEQAEERLARLTSTRADAGPAVEQGQVEFEKAQAQLAKREDEHQRHVEAAEQAHRARETRREQLTIQQEKNGDRATLEQARQQLDRLVPARLDLERVQLELRQAEERRLAAEDALEIVRLGWQAAEGDEKEARQQAKQVRERAARTEEAFNFARREDMAIHLANQLELNQPCPVCDQIVRELPAFRLTAAIEEAELYRDQAHRQREASEQNLLEASKTAAGRQQALEHAEERLEEAQQAVEAAAMDLDSRSARVLELSAKLQEAVDPDVASDVETLEDWLREAEERLAQRTAQVELAEERLRQAESKARETQHAVEIATQQKLNAEQSWKAARQTQDRAEVAWREAENTVAESRRGIVERLGAEASRERLESARHQLARATQTLNRARDVERASAQDLEATRQKAEAVRAEQESLLRRLAGLAGQLGLDLDDPSATLTLRELAQRVRQQERAQRRQLQLAQRQAERAVHSAAECRDNLWRELDLPQDVGFERALAQAQSASQQAAQRVEELENSLRQAGEAERRLTLVEQKIQLFHRLSEDLTPSRFLRYLLNEERMDLADLGSERFEMLSGGRYRFSADGTFAVLDLANAEAVRKAETLSGGESFLASLALALALAEKVTGRGGRLDAFFLDEGFGSLDPEHFDLAMEGIERLVTDSPGRLITVVSHVPEMRQRVEDLIILDKDPRDGSTLIRQGSGRVGSSHSNEKSPA